MEASGCVYNEQTTDLLDRRLFAESMLCSKSVRMVPSAARILSGYREKASGDNLEKSRMIVAQGDAATQTVPFPCDMSNQPYGITVARWMSGWAIACAAA